MFWVEKRCAHAFFSLRGRPGNCPGAPLASPEGSGGALLAAILALRGLPDDLPVNSGGPLGARKGPGSDFERFWVTFGCPGCLPGAISRRFRGRFPLLRGSHLRAIAICHLLLLICCWLQATCYVLLTPCPLLLATCHLLRAMQLVTCPCYLLLATCCLLRAGCYLLRCTLLNGTIPRSGLLLLVYIYTPQSLIIVPPSLIRVTPRFDP